MLIQAIITKINKYFSDYDIYGEEIKQGFEERCFFIQKLPDYRYKEIQSYCNRSSFDIHCFLDKDTQDLNEKYEEIGNDLYQILEYVELESGRKIRGIDMHYEIVDNVLHFYITYIYQVRTIIESDKMQTLDVKESVKNDEI